jgi:hypothetical protein|tara:strand:- start:238 stop:564 length:327 start_codon:yes stop_codon:yes gene_type:complete
MTMMNLKKKLKDPNEKSAIQKFVGGKIPHYLAVAAFLYAFIGTGGFLLGMITGAEKKAEQQLQDKITEIVDKELMMRFPQTSGPVLRTQKDNQQWVDFINKDNQNGNP